MVRSLTAGIAAVAALLPAPVVAQGDSGLTLHSRSRFSGTRLSINGPTQFLEFEARSVAVPAGEEWELCTGNKFTGCRRFSQSVPALVITVRSARPAMTAAGPISVATAAAVAGQSVRGVASEYFVVPESGGYRIEVPTGAASQRADEFCRTRGWSSSAHATVQSVAGRAYLADVLCVRTGS